MGIYHLDMVVRDGHPCRIYESKYEDGCGESYVYDRDAGKWYRVVNSDEDVAR